MPVTLPVLFDSKQVANKSSIRALIIDECYTTICFTVEKYRQWLTIWMHCYCSYGLCVLIILLTANVLYGCFECLSDTLPLIICIIKWRDYVLMLYPLSYGLCVLIILRTANVLCDCFECLSDTLALIICIIKRRDYVLPG